VTIGERIKGWLWTALCSIGILLLAVASVPVTLMWFLWMYAFPAAVRTVRRMR
jgi:hypothetical protein